MFSFAGKEYQELEKAHGLNKTQLNKKNRENSYLLYKILILKNSVLLMKSLMTFLMKKI